MDRIQFFLEGRAGGARRIVRSVMNGHVTLYRNGDLNDPDGKGRWVEIEIPGEKSWTFSVRSREEFEGFCIPWISYALSREVVFDEESSTATEEVWIVN